MSCICELVLQRRIHIDPRQPNIEGNHALIGQTHARYTRKMDRWIDVLLPGCEQILQAGRGYDVDLHYHHTTLPTLSTTPRQGRGYMALP